MNYDEINDIGIYKANRKQTGSAAQFKISDKSCMFLDISKQIAPMDNKAPFDWGNKICVKLGQTDISKMLAFFHPQLMYYRTPPKPLSIFHKNPRGTKTLELKWQERDYKGEKIYSYYLSVTSKEGDDFKNVGLPISLDEVELLKVGFTRALEIILGW